MCWQNHDDERPTLLLTNQMKTSASQFVDRYVRRMASDLEFQRTLTTSGLCQLLAVRVGLGKRNARSRILSRTFVKTPADITIANDGIDVRIGRRANIPFLLTAACDEADIAVSWLRNRRLRISFP